MKNLESALVFNVVFSLEWEDLFFDLGRFINWRMNESVQLFIWKHNVHKQMRRGIVLGKESALGAWGWSRRVALIKSLIYARNHSLNHKGCLLCYIVESVLLTLCFTNIHICTEISVHNLWNRTGNCTFRTEQLCHFLDFSSKFTLKLILKCHSNWMLNQLDYLNLMSFGLT